MNKLDRWSSNEISRSHFEDGRLYDSRDWCRSEDVRRLEADYAKLEAKYAELEGKYAELEASHAELLATAKAVVERWDSPLWREQEHTSTFINRLRAAIARAEGEVMP